jgi:hypothetical protein
MISFIVVINDMNFNKNYTFRFFKLGFMVLKTHEVIGIKKTPWSILTSLVQLGWFFLLFLTSGQMIHKCMVILVPHVSPFDLCFYNQMGIWFI